jgi:hypothetical protein
MRPKERTEKQEEQERRVKRELRRSYQHCCLCACGNMDLTQQLNTIQDRPVIMPSVLLPAFLLKKLYISLFRGQLYIIKKIDINFTGFPLNFFFRFSLIVYYRISLFFFPHYSFVADESQGKTGHRGLTLFLTEKYACVVIFK